jgi:iron complex transport system substrate-binding protein
VSATPSQRVAASPSAAATAARTAYPLTIQDIAGRRVTLARRPERIVSLAPSTTETLFALGLGERVVGVDQSSDYPPAARGKPRIGTFSQPSIEAVVAQSPDLVLAANLHLRAAVPALEARGLTVVVLNPADLAAVLDSITLVGQLTDSANMARQLRGDLERRIAAVEARLPQAAIRPRVYVEITAKLVAAGPTSPIGNLIDRAGGSNIVVERGTQYPTLGAEAIIAADPDVIILTNADGEVTVASVGARPGWAGIGAVRQGRVVAVDPNVLNRTGPRAVDALELLARAFHPELFR